MSGEWDAFVLFLLVVLLTLPLVTSLDRSRRLVLLRNDLARWVDHRSATTGEPPGAIVERAVARHRSGSKRSASPHRTATRIDRGTMQPRPDPIEEEEALGAETPSIVGLHGHGVGRRHALGVISRYDTAKPVVHAAVDRMITVALDAPVAGQS